MKYVVLLALAAACQAARATPQQREPKILLRGATRAHLADQVKANTPAWARLKATVDRWVSGEDLWGFHAWNAALVGQLTGDAKYCTAAIAAVDKQVAAAEAAIAAGKPPEVAGDSYLHVGEMIGDVALVADWCEPSADQRKRWVTYADQAVSNVWHHDTATWGGKPAAWTGWGTTDPSNNYYFSFLRATMLLGLATGNQTWLDTFDKAKLENVDGGGSLEGTGYGVAMRELWEIYDWWQASTGKTIATPHAHASLRTFLHQVLPTLDRVAPTGDQSRDSTAALFDYHRSYLAELAHLFPTDPLAARAKYVLAHGSVPKMSQGFMVAYDFLYDDAIVEKPLDLPTAYLARGIGQLYARSGWDAHATWLNFTAGPYVQSHAHQDQGALLLYKDGWLAYDAVIDSHSGLRQEPAAHSLVRVDGGAQRVAHTTSKLTALHRGKGWLYADADLTPAYDGNAHVKRVERALVYLEPDVVVVADHVVSDAPQTWQLATPVAPARDGTIKTAAHALHVTRLAPTDAKVAIVLDLKSDPSNDYTGGHRYDETVAAGDRTYLHVLAIDNAVKSASSSSATTVDLVLADGRAVTIAFHDHLVIAGTRIGLDAKVDALPE